MRKIGWIMIVTSVLVFFIAICFTKFYVDSFTEPSFIISPDGIPIENDNEPSDPESGERLIYIILISYVSGGVLLISGVVSLIINTAKKKGIGAVVRQVGVVLERESGKVQDCVIVELDDCTRRKLMVDPSIILVRGDRGIIGYQGKLLVEFQKMM